MSQEPATSPPNSKAAGETQYYEVTLFTPKSHGAGTDARITIHFDGEQGQLETVIDNPSRNDREQGQEDTYHVYGPLVQPIRKIGFRLDPKHLRDNWPWKCDWVRVIHPKTG